MKLGEQPASMTIEVWVVPGEHQTLEQLVEKFGDRVVMVDVANNRALVSRETHGLLADQ